MILDSESSCSSYDTAREEFDVPGFYVCYSSNGTLWLLPHAWTNWQCMAARIRLHIPWSTSTATQMGTTASLEFHEHTQTSNKLVAVFDFSDLLVGGENVTLTVETHRGKRLVNEILDNFSTCSDRITVFETGHVMFPVFTVAEATTVAASSYDTRDTTSFDVALTTFLASLPILQGTPERARLCTDATLWAANMEREIGIATRVLKPIVTYTVVSTTEVHILVPAIDLVRCARDTCNMEELSFFFGDDTTFFRTFVADAARGLYNDGNGLLIPLETLSRYNPWQFFSRSAVGQPVKLNMTAYNLLEYPVLYASIQEDDDELPLRFGIELNEEAALRWRT